MANKQIIIIIITTMLLLGTAIPLIIMGHQEGHTITRYSTVLGMIEQYFAPLDNRTTQAGCTILLINIIYIMGINYDRIYNKSR